MKILIAECRFQHSLQHYALRRDGAVAVIRPPEQLLGEGIDHHVSRSRIERHHFRGQSSGWNSCEVRDAADILKNPPALRMRE